MKKRSLVRALTVGKWVDDCRRGALTFRWVPRNGLEESPSREDTCGDDTSDEVESSIPSSRAYWLNARVNDGSDLRCGGLG